MNLYERILIAVDLGSLSERVLQHAKAIAGRFGSSLELLHCMPNPSFPDATGLLNPMSPDAREDLRRETERQLDTLLTPEEHAQYKARAIVIVGDPLDEIVEHAQREKIDLIVMGTHGRTGLTHLVLGSVAERVVRTAPCPVLTVR